MAPGRWIPLLVLAVAAAGCGAGHESSAPSIERTFHVAWHDVASQEHASYSASEITFHAGRWSARIAITNDTGKPLYETAWSPPGDYGITWNGPALVYSGLDVLQNRRLIYVPADREEPDIPSPLPPGATWHGTISGRVPTKPQLPRASQIWIRYPVFDVGTPASGLTPLQWISQKAIEL